jgi:hypothetical protein
MFHVCNFSIIFVQPLGNWGFVAASFLQRYEDEENLVTLDIDHPAGLSH